MFWFLPVGFSDITNRLFIRSKSGEILEGNYSQRPAEIYGFACTPEGLTDIPVGLDLGFKVKQRFTNPGFSIN